MPKTDGGSHNSSNGAMCPHDFVKRTRKEQQESAQTMLSLPMMNCHEVNCSENIKKMSCREMERALHKDSRRPAEHIRGAGAPQTARALLEENKQLVHEKQQRKALDRQNSREFVEKLLADDRVVNEADRAKDIGRRTAQKGLAQYYKAKIAEKEAEKSNAYEKKLERGVDIQFFPFVEGETISRHRQADAEKMRQEMKSFLHKQQLQNPPRVDALMADSDMEYQHRYPFMPVYNQCAPLPLEDPPASARASSSRRGAAVPASREGGSDAAGEDAPHLSRYPKFLQRSREHMSRRIQDAHVRKALEDKVERTKAELQELTRRHKLEAQQWEEGLAVNDALRYDGTRMKAIERQKNAEYLKQQVQERRDKESKDVEARRAEIAGYWGPDEKALRDPENLRNHCTELIKQMEVNQNRKLDSRSKRLVQERNVIDNSLAEMSADRLKEKEKYQVHREILKQTWDSQRKIREVMTRIDNL